MSSPLEQYRNIWVIDTEFRCPAGGQNQPVCLCAHGLVNEERLEVFFDRPRNNPFDYEDSLFVCYSAAAEWKTFISLGWELPENVIDLHFEYLNYINGVWRGNYSLRNLGSGLVDALVEFGLDGLSHEEKEEEREYILSHTTYPPEGQRRILDYCWSDVDGTEKLFGQMLPNIDLDQALFRGLYSLPVAFMEHNGLPISPQYQEVDDFHDEIRLAIAQELEAQHGYGVYRIQGKSRPRPVFDRANFENLVVRLGLSDIWPLTVKGYFSTADEKAFEPMAKICPELEPLRQARKSINGLNLVSTSIGSGNRNRAGIRPLVY